jgi:hypothetical protein
VIVAEGIPVQVACRVVGISESGWYARLTEGAGHAVVADGGHDAAVGLARTVLMFCPDSARTETRSPWSV